MKKKSLLTLENLSDKTLDKIIDLSFKVKNEKEKYYKTLKGKNLGLIFEKPSTRTRVSFEVGMHQLGGNSFSLSPGQLQPGKREPLKDIARTLSRYLDCLVLRTFSHDSIVEIDKYCTIPVINGLSDYCHPCQALADYMTICEKSPKTKDVKVAYIGDGNNVVNSLLMLLSRKGVHFTVASPSKFAPNKIVVEKAMALSKKSGSTIEICKDPAQAVCEADYIYTDVWISMGEESSKKDASVFAPYQVNGDLLSKAKPGAYVMHCLPAHRGQEITDEVIESDRSIVFDQAENRLHVQKAALIHLLT
ncbi:MAG: ornithine carbamoyltransferase [Candidatus Omnitrophica bacterium]|nr:ornithine carbamoyltransferase [Candidatus Omnitrophota bacterium]